MSANPFNWNFDNVVPASALFFNNELQQKAVRLEVAAIALEFTDNVFIGIDPEGFLYFDDLNDFNMKTHGGTDVVHRYKVLQSNKDGTTYAVIEFRRDSDTDAYAKFVAKDSKNAVSAAGMAPSYSSHGEWDKLTLGSSIATVEKSGTNPTITLSADAIRKKGTWDSGSVTLKPKSFTVDGTLYFKNVTKLKDGVYANYTNDRIVFYQNDWSGRDFTAFFIPLGISTETLGVAGANQTFKSVAWSDMPNNN